MALPRSRPASAQLGLPVAVDTQASERLPCITAFLSQSVWGPGEPRRTGSLLVCAEDGRWKCWINDRDALRSAWVSADSLLDLLNGVERGLSEDRLDWRSDKRKRG